ncbi:MAG: DUF1501 domain-containing protein [Pseudomonadota bacterium]
MKTSLLPTNTTRRSFLTQAGLWTAAGLLPIKALSAATPQDRKIVLIILRGALDGLAAVAPIADRRYEEIRGSLSLIRETKGGKPLSINDGFALHPALKTLHSLYQENEAAIIHAAASPYRKRSHFDGQDVLEAGGDKVFGLRDGWLNRALVEASRLQGGTRKGIGIGASLPLVLRGPGETSSWAPAVMRAVEDDTTARLMDMYANDPLLGPALADAIATEEIVDANGMSNRQRGRRQQPATLLKAAANLVTADGGADAAVVALDGWDTHANQGASTGSLANKLKALDEGIAALRETLGPAWANTAVVVATEFGRTVAVNGTRGTDHGTGGVAFVLGGLVRGGRFHGDWPGLSQNALYQGRDLAPTNDLRGVFKGVLSGVWGLESRSLDQRVFPDSGSARRMDRLIV